MNGTRKSRCTGRAILPVLGFLVLFAILVLMVSKFYLLPGLDAAKHATHAHRRKLAAEALLLMIILLSILVVGLMITFRISRFFFPSSNEIRSRTKYVDAWAEAGNRLTEESTDQDHDEE